MTMKRYQDAPKVCRHLGRLQISNPCLPWQPHLSGTPGRASNKIKKLLIAEIQDFRPASFAVLKRTPSTLIVLRDQTRLNSIAWSN